MKKLFLKTVRCLAGSMLLVFWCGLVVSCGLGSKNFPPVRAERVMYEWHDDGGPGKIKVTISLVDQIAEFERGGRPIGWCYVATGKEGHGTPAAQYKIIEKIEDKYSTKYGWFEDEFGVVTDNDAKSTDRVPKGMTYVPAPMPYWMRLTSAGIGMHGGLIPEPGKPASHGCIRMPKEFVPMLFDAVEIGTPVLITREKRKHAPYMGPHSPSAPAAAPLAGQPEVGVFTFSGPP